eukprot:6192264-Pleurochrysis_carterae.AAC.3
MMNDVSASVSVSRAALCSNRGDQLDSHSAALPLLAKAICILQRARCRLSCLHMRMIYEQIYMRPLALRARGSASNSSGCKLSVALLAG